MSTVLKAVQEIERRATPLASSLEPRESADRRSWPIVAAGIVAVAVVAAFVAMRGTPHVQPAAPVITAPPRARVAVEPPMARPAPAVVAPAAAPLPVEEEAPRGQVVTDTSVPAAPRAAVAKAASRAEASEARRQTARVERRPRVAALPPPPPVYEEEETEIEPELAPPPAPANGRASASGPLPRVELRAIGYANNPDARTVTLRVGGGPAVTMHEGESMQGVDVQLILPGSVYLRHGGSIFSIGR